MKKKFLWLLLLVPAFFVAASSPVSNMNMDWQSSDCSTSGDKYDAYNGEHGCPYTYNFMDFVSCQIDSIDLDNNTPQIEHYLNNQTAQVWLNNNNIVEMYPNDGYGGEGFLVTLNVRIYFNGGGYEDEWWNCNVSAGSPPYPNPCY